MDIHIIRFLTLSIRSDFGNRKTFRFLALQLNCFIHACKKPVWWLWGYVKKMSSLLGLSFVRYRTVDIDTVILTTHRRYTIISSYIQPYLTHEEEVTTAACMLATFTELNLSSFLTRAQPHIPPPFSFSISCFLQVSLLPPFNTLQQEGFLSVSLE